MFEKSLVDLIRSLRSHKGSEATYIAAALKECRNEVRSQDMDVKATALLKLVYLEMFGYDMTWAAFNVLEVMSSAKPLQKRVGYLAASQSFRPETEVLMLAENLLKKDLSSPDLRVLALPLGTIPHIVTAELALSVLTELLPRLTHSQVSVRKKTVVALYRLALVYPETLKVAWPKIKEKLMDANESSNVTAASVNVICELGWRQPREFLALAPRLFDLLTGDKNNWMSIKIIKLFAVLTPLEPRLVKKLVRPLTKILRETHAMSLLYECISGIIQGGILDGADAGVDVDEVADLCTSKLRGMIVLEGDPNLKYVALLAFNKIVGSHPRMVSAQQDVIMACLDDPDITIKMQALELVSGMVDADNLQTVVNRLLKQLASAPKDDADGVSSYQEENTDLEQRLVPDKRSSELTPIPDEYRQDMISRILDMCSSNTYTNITDFEWYIDILVHLVRHLPSVKNDATERAVQPSSAPSLGTRIGAQLLDISVRVQELRAEATLAAETLTLMSNRTILYASHQGGQPGVLKSTAWICGEYADHLSQPHEVLNSLIHESSLALPASTLSTYIQAIPKLIARITALSDQSWNVSRSSTLSLILARTTTFLERLSLHPNLEVQERAVEFLELLKITSESLSTHPDDSISAPTLLSAVLPSLFAGQALNPVAATAQSRVPLPPDLDLDTPINPDLNVILSASQVEDSTETGPDVFDRFYHEREPDLPASQTLERTSRMTSYTDNEPEPQSYQSYQAPDSPATLARRKADRVTRARDDPFYIAPSGSHSSTSLGQSGADDLDIDSIPIIDLQLENAPAAHDTEAMKPRKKKTRKFAIAADETLDTEPTSASQPASLGTTPKSTSMLARSYSPSLQPTNKSQPGARPTRNLLSIPSSQLSGFSLSGSDTNGQDRPLTVEDLRRREEEEKEMAEALREIEMKRLELQRVQERAGVSYAEGVNAEGEHVVRKKKKKKKAKEEDEMADEGEGEVVKKKKKKVKRKADSAREPAPEVGGDEEAERYQD